MGDFKQKLNDYNSCDRIKKINEANIQKQKMKVKKGLNKAISKLNLNNVTTTKKPA